MPSYNSKQKLYIYLAVAIFIIINLIALLFALPTLTTGRVQGIFTDNTSTAVLVNGNIEKNLTLLENKEVITNSESLYFDNVNYTFLALPQSKVSFGDLNSAKVQFGIGYIESKREFEFTLKDWVIILAKNSKVIFDAEEGTITVLKGTATISAKEFNAGYVASLNDIKLIPSIIDKTSLLTNNKISEINKILVGKSNFLPEINFSSKPEANILDSQEEITTNKSQFEITGSTSKINKVYINLEPVDVNEEGFFTKLVNVEKGMNYFDVTIVDDLANTFTKTLKIISNI